MLKVAILDDYQNVSQDFVDLKKLLGKYEIRVFNEPFADENDAIGSLENLIINSNYRVFKSNTKKMSILITPKKISKK